MILTEIQDSGVTSFHRHQLIAEKKVKVLTPFCGRGTSIPPTLTCCHMRENIFPHFWTLQTTEHPSTFYSDIMFRHYSQKQKKHHGALQLYP